MNRFVRRRGRLRQVALGIAATVCAAQLGSTGQARGASPGAFTLAWSAPDDCPSQQQVEMQIARLVGRDLRIEEGSDLQADVTVSRGPLWSADLTTRQAGRTGHRSIEAPSCQAAADAIALIIALSIDPDAVAASAPPVPAPAPPVPQAPVSPERRLHVLVSVHAQGRTGTSPETDVGAGVGIGLAGARWRAHLRGTYELRRDQVASGPTGASGRFNVATGSLTACLDVAGISPAFGPCAVAEAGIASASGYGVTAGFSKDVPWLAAGGGVFGSLAVAKHLRAAIELDALASLYRPDYVFEDIPGVVFKAPAVGGRALVDVWWQF